MANKNKKQKHPKVQPDQYLYDASEPKDISSHTLTSGLDYVFLEDSPMPKSRFRQYAQRLRNRYG